MKLENQVCTLEQAKKLKELGIVQDSLFYHIECNPNVFEIEQIDENSYKNYDKGDPVFSAFTVAELGEMLPTRSYICSFRDNGYLLYSRNVGDFQGDTVADCLAQVVIAYNRLSPTIQESEP